MTDALRRALTEIDPETNNTRLNKVIENWLTKATTGSFSHLKELLVRIEGKPGEGVETGQSPLLLRMQALLNRHVTTPAHRAPKRSPKSGRQG